MFAHRKSVNAYARAKGVTLVEVLVALVVLSLGVLGAAALQLESLKAAHYSYQVTVANLIAKDIKEKLWIFHAADIVAEDDPGSSSSNTKTFFMSCPIPVDPSSSGLVDEVDGTDWTVSLGSGYFLQEWSEMPGIVVGGSGEYWELDERFDNMNKLPDEASVTIQPQAETSSPLPSGMNSGDYGCDYVVTIEWENARVEESPVSLEYYVRLPGLPFKHALYIADVESPSP